MGRKVKKWEESASLNMRTYLFWIDYITGLATNMFKWEGLPDTIDPRFLEMTLIHSGVGIYFNNDVPQPEYFLDVGRVFCQTTYGIELDIYNYPIYRDAWANNGFFKAMLTPADSVLIFNNRTHTPDIDAIELFARRFTMLDRAMDTNVNGQKFPYLIRATNKQRLTLQNVYMELDGNQPCIVVDKDLDPDSISVLSTNSPYVTDKLEVQKHSLFNNLLTYFGIENANQDKRERMVANEVNSNYGVVEASRNIRLQSRRDALPKIKDIFGDEITVTYNSDLPTILNMGMEALNFKGGRFDEPLDNTSEVDSGADDPGI